MPVFSSMSEIITDDIIVDVSNKLAAKGNNVFLKIEALNPCGSIKLKTAKFLVDAVLENRSKKKPRLIESSSGNLGIALASICAERGLSFECVVDKNTLADKREHIASLGARVTVITEPDENGGYLGSRLRYIKDRLARDPELVWTNQYGNFANILAHYSTTAPSLLRAIGPVDYVFIGAGTTGTLLGCIKYFQEHSPATRIIAVDARGSVTFGARPEKRYIPGIGTSQRPEMLDEFSLYPREIVYADERDTIFQCRRFSRRSGILIGGSTGSVLAAAEQYIARHHLSGQIIALISPDLGGSYLSTIYNDRWVRDRFPAGYAPSESQPHWSEESDVVPPEEERESANGARLRLS